MRAFDVRRSYSPERDVRDHAHLLDLLLSLPANGVVWPLVGARRAGKTWTLKALEHHLGSAGGMAVRYMDLRRAGPTLPVVPSGITLLLDEPQLAGKGGSPRDATAFLRWCDDLYRANTRVLLAMSPAEWVALERAAGGDAGLLSSRDMRFLDPLTPDEALKLARTDASRALLPALPAIWRRNPFLLEFVFELAEQSPDLAEEPWTLLWTARVRSELREFAYHRAVFEDGLTDAQRGVLREVARGAAPRDENVDLLERCGLVQRRGGRSVLADPILEANLCPLRIHHVSDIHFGPKSAERVDVKEKGKHGDMMAPALGPPRVCDHYVEHVAELAAAGRAPHLLVVSGDIAEWADDAQYAEARVWLQKLCRHLADHPRLPPNEPNVLLVGGNHDVDWRQAATPAPAGTQARHAPFARAFDDHPRCARPRLEDPPEARALAVARYADLGVEFALLGSAEFGGQAEADPVRDELLALIGRLRQGAMEEPDADRAAVLRDHVARIDPGLVHDADLQRVRRAQWHAPIRIAVLHHPVSPLPSTELARFGGLINAGEVKDALVHKEFCLVLHGHSHTGWFGKEQWPERHEDWTIRIAAAPSLSSREVQEHNGYNEVEIARDGVGGDVSYRIHVHRVVREGATWTRRSSMGPFAPGK
ncbi:metallophosphoesterase family protein [Sorangium sp. So ce1151]|uniref:metallophosphoesterase family protein n=1 Tax=Sorangium sp. So ce1151 TaxID=3133332 RepID=UPI003F602A96